MKKITLLIFIIFLFIFNAKPQIALNKTVIQEIFFAQEKWYLVVNFEGVNINNQDTLRLISTSGFSLFNYKHDIQNKFVIVTSDSLQTDLTILRSGDLIRLEKFSNNQWIRVGWTIYFGDIPQSNVNSPDVGQSLVITNIGYDMYVIESNAPSLGQNSVVIENNGGISGLILKDNKPIPGAMIECIQNASNAIELSEEFPSVSTFNILQTNSDSMGYFQINNLVGMKYNINIYVGDSIYTLKSVTVEPNVISNENLILENIKDVNPNKLINYAIDNSILSVNPNIFSENTTIKICNTNFINGNFTIKIINQLGQVVDQINLAGYQSLNNVNITYNGLKLIPGSYKIILYVNGNMKSYKSLIKV